MKSYRIPYGVIQTNNEGNYDKLIEKPTLSYKLNTGMYIMEPEVLKLVDSNSFLHITTLIENAKNLGKRIGVFPITEKSWIDIGEWKSYLSTFEVEEK